MKYKGKTDLSSGSVEKNIMAIAIPMTLAEILHLLYNVVDRIFIGHIPTEGSLALPGIGICFPIISLVTAFSKLYGSNGGSPVFNIERGRGNDEEALYIQGSSFMLIVITGFLLSLIGLLFARPLLFLFGASEQTYPYAYAYFSIYLIGFVPSLITLGMNPFVNAQGYGFIGMGTTVIGAVCNLLLDPIFIFVFGWGIRGAAIATVIGHIVNFSIGLSFYLFGKTHFFKFNMYDLNHINWNYIIQISAIGLSSALLNICNGVATIVYNNVIGKYDNALSILAVLTSLDSICVMPCVGIRQGVVPIYGYNYGEKNFKRMYIIFLVGILYTTIYGAIMTFIIRRFPGFFINLFLGNATEEVMNEAIRICGFYQIGLSIVGLNMISSGFFQASRHKVEASLLSIMRQCLFLIPSLYIFDSLFNSRGVWYAMPVSDALSGVVGLLLIIASYITYKKTGYISIKDSKQYN